MLWKADWAEAQANLEKWWAHKGMAAFVTAPRDKPIEDIPAPAVPADVDTRWLDPAYRCSQAQYNLSRTFFGCEGYPFFDTQIGPGSLGIFLGAEPVFADTTVWYRECISDPDSCKPIRFDPSNRWFNAQMAIIDEGLRRAGGRHLVGMPDLIEGLDTLAAMRGSEPLLMDCIERPAWVCRRLEEINQAYFEAFDAIHAKIKDDEGGNAYCCFNVWGPGRTAKLQSDISCMLSPAMFAQFVTPYLKAQCDWLDYSIYHLDGTTALQHVDALLGIDSLQAIQWTPQAGKPPTDDEIWFDLYKRIKAGGKNVQVTCFSADRIRPLLDSVGPEGMWVGVQVQSMDEAHRAMEIIKEYR